MDKIVQVKECGSKSAGKKVKVNDCRLKNAGKRVWVKEFGY